MVDEFDMVMIVSSVKARRRREVQGFESVCIESRVRADRN